jgi:hypothetical protein
MARLPDNFPPGTRFWLVSVDIFADDGSGALLRTDGTVVGGTAADALRQLAAGEGVEITEEEFRMFAPSFVDPELSDVDKITGDPELEKAFLTLISSVATVAASPRAKQICQNMLRSAPRPNQRRFAARVLLELAAKKQKRDAQ